MTICFRKSVVLYCFVCINVDNMDLFRFFKKHEKTSEDIYNEGQHHAHVLHDYDTAFKLYTQAADMGLKEAKYDLAVLYASGNGTPKNLKRAAEILKPLADGNMPEAEEFLAVLYLKGEGVEKDYEMALRYFKKGIVLENPEALLCAGICLANMKPMDDDKVGKIIRYWTKAANLGDVNAKVNLGLLYYDGNIVSQDYKEAFKWFTEAAEAGNIVGIFQAGLCYQKGRGVEKDIEKAIEYYKKGMEHGDVQCAHNLGSIYLDRKDLKEAYNCYRIGANKGYKPSAEMCDRILAFVHKQNASGNVS